MRIEYLADYIHFAEEIAGWIYEEFIKGIREGITYEQVLESRKSCFKTELPIRLAAIEGDTCVGTVALVHNDLKCREYTPWLASLYVHPSYRKNKIGEQLIERVKSIAREMGYAELYLRTEHASGYYRRLGWQFVETCKDEFGLEPDVFRWDLS